MLKEILGAIRYYAGEILVIGMIFALVTFMGVLSYTAWVTRQEIIKEKTGKEVSWVKAASYPDEFFMDAVVKIN